ncbi:prolyl oligopeptidase family serine peptidase [Streptomyces umbrinus]|uniref:prolyl oligopeptidase family serine peptidase n=1 Tax=Streptomyces umbrinus TaxID=67370 RepID=UPI003C2E0D34
MRAGWPRVLKNSALSWYSGVLIVPSPVRRSSRAVSASPRRIASTHSSHTCGPSSPVDLAPPNPRTRTGPPETSSTPPFLLLHGSADPLVSPSHRLNLFTALKDKGVDAKRVVLTGAGHGDMTVTAAIPSASPSGPSDDASSSADGAAKPWSTKKTINFITDFLAGHTEWAVADGTSDTTRAAARQSAPCPPDGAGPAALNDRSPPASYRASCRTGRLPSPTRTTPLHQPKGCPGRRPDRPPSHVVRALKRPQRQAQPVIAADPRVQLDLRLRVTHEAPSGKSTPHAPTASPHVASKQTDIANSVRR